MPVARPHVLLIVADQLSSFSLRSPSNTFPDRTLVPPTHATPNLERLRAEGASIEQFLVSFAACTPSRHALLTSIHPDRLHRADHWLDERSSRQSIGHAMARGGGYATYWVGKFHLTGDFDTSTGEGLPIASADGTLPAGTAGFAHTRYMFHRFSHPKTAIDVDELGGNGSHIRRAVAQGAGDGCAREAVTWLNPSSSAVRLSNDVPCTEPHRHYVTHALFRWAWQLLDRHIHQPASNHADGAATTPAFLVLSLPDPHPAVGGYVVSAPYQPPPDTMNDATPFEPPKSYWDDLPIVSTDARPLAASLHELRRGGFKGGPMAHLKRMRGAYLGMVRAIDDCVGEMMARLHAAGIGEDTLMIFTSDHGDLAGAHGMRGKLTTYEEAVRVPLLVRWPRRVPAGQRVSSRLIASVDVLPTMLGLLQLPRQTGSDGTDLHHLLLGEAAHSIGEDSDRAGEDEMVISSGGVEYAAVISHEWWLSIESPERARTSEVYYDRGADLASLRCVPAAALSVGASAPSCRLWHRPSDPLQMVNSYQRHPNVVRRLLRALHAHTLRMSAAVYDTSLDQQAVPRCRADMRINCTRAFAHPNGVVHAPESLLCHEWYRAVMAAVLTPPHDAFSTSAALALHVASEASATATDLLSCHVQWRERDGAALSAQQARKAARRSVTSSHFRGSDKVSKRAFARLSGTWRNVRNTGDMDSVMAKLGVGPTKRAAEARRQWGVDRLVHVLHAEHDSLTIHINGTSAPPVQLKADGSSHLLAVPGHGPHGERVRATVSIEHPHEWPVGSTPPAQGAGVVVNRMPRKRLEVRRYLCGREDEDQMCLMLIVGGNMTATRIFQRVGGGIVPL